MEKNKVVAVELNNTKKKIWNRRFKSVVLWFVLCVTLIIGQRYLGFEKGLVNLIIEKSAWILGLLIVGLSGTNLMHDWIKK